ncbi:putative hemolysin [Komagataeibacter europaeus]|uniref:putative hemolysin n=1 Tax=Komagataeibacter europaeus TaxID=33995 RepID=UPI000237DE9C|nr:DUF333 domain-containing protein [Komagataeibacter europaeus]
MTYRFPFMRHLARGVVLGGIMLQGACASGHHAPAHASRAGMANPASVYCQQRGGTLEMRPSPQGVTGWCHLPDGTVIEEWALFRRDHATAAP